MQLSEIWVYPVKSLGGISLQHAQVLPKGLALDRRWMLIDENNRFITQRKYPKMVLFKVEVEGQNLIIRFEGDSLVVPIKEKYSDEMLKAEIWEDEVVVEPVQGKSETWFAEKLGASCRLVFFRENHARPVAPYYQIDNDQVNLSDGFPYLLVGQSSLDDLNQRLERPVPMRRFRPNLVFTGGQPYEEDLWKQFRVGDVLFECRKACSRCIIITINEETGEKGKEPLKSLSAYRSIDGKVKFGQNVLALTQGTIRVNDPIFLLDK